MSNESTRARKRPRAKGTGSCYTPKGAKTFWIAYTGHDGKRHFENTHYARERDAHTILTKRIGAIDNGVSVTPKIGKLTLAEGVQAVVEDASMNGRKSIDGTKRRITLHLLPYFSPHRRMSSITMADIERYKASRIAAAAKNATVNRELAVLRRAFRLAVRGGVLASMPHVAMLQEDNVRTGFFERDMFDAVLAHLPEHLHPPLEFMYTTGWRTSEVLTLMASHVDLQHSTVTLPVGSTKNRRGRVITMTAAVRAVLTRQLAAIDVLKARDVICPYVFHQPDGAPIKSFRKRWTAARTAAGYPKALLHDFRRTAVRAFVRAGIPERVCMTMTGHVTRSTFERYNIVSDGDLQAAAAKLDAAAERGVTGDASTAQIRALPRASRIG